MRNRLVWALVAWEIVILVMASGVGWSMRSHDRRLDDWKRSLYEAPLPPGAHLIERGAALTDGGHFDFGSPLTRYRDHCEYRVWVVFDTSLDLSGVDHFYERTQPQLAGLAVGVSGAGRVRIERVDTRTPGWDPRCNRGFGL